MNYELVPKNASTSFESLCTNHKGSNLKEGSSRKGRLRSEATAEQAERLEQLSSGAGV